MKRTTNILKYISASLLLFVVLLFLLLSAGVFNPLVKSSICKIASAQINGEVFIARLEGNLFSNFSLDSVHISDGTNEIITLGSLKVNYRLGALFSRHLIVDTVLLSHPMLYLSEGTDSIWSIAKLLPEREAAPTDTSSTLWSMTVNNFVIQQLGIEIAPLDTSLAIPRSLNADLNVSLSYSQDKALMTVQHLSMKTQNPYFHIVDLALETEMDDSHLSWHLFELVLDQSAFTSVGALPLLHPELGSFTLEASPLDLNDFKPWLSGMYGSAYIDVELVQKGDSSILNVGLCQQTQSLNVIAKMWNSEATPQYSIKARLDSLNMAYWTHKADFESTTKGLVEVQGEGLDVETNSITLKADFVDLDYEKYEVSDLSISLQKKEGNMNARIHGHTVLGDVESDIELSHLFAVPTYKASIDVKHLNMAKVVDNPLLESDLNFKIKAQGVDVVPGVMRSSISIESNNSYLFGDSFSDMKATCLIDKNSYKIEGLRFNASYLEAYIGGSGNLSSENNLQFGLKIKDSEPLLSALGYDAFYADGEIMGRINGPVDNLILDADLSIAQLDMDSLRIANMTTHLHSVFSYGAMGASMTPTVNPISAITPQNFSAKISSWIGELVYKDHAISDVRLALNKEKESIIGQVSTQAFSGRLATEFKVINAFSAPEYTLKTSVEQLDFVAFSRDDSLHTSINLDIVAKGEGISRESLDIEVAVQSKDSEAFGKALDNIDSKIIYKRGYYLLDNLDIKTPFVDASIEGEGYVDAYNKLDFYLTVKDLEPLKLNFIPNNLDFTGQIHGSVTGTRDSLMLASQVDIDDFRMDTVHVKNLLADASLQICDSIYSGFFNLILHKAKVQNLPFDTIQFVSQFTHERAQNTFAYYSSDSLNGRLYTTLELGHTPTLHFNDMILNFEHDSWLGGSDSSYIRFGQEAIELHAIKAHSNEGSLEADGLFSFYGDEKFYIDVRDMDIRRIKGIQLLPIPITGNLNAGLTVAGTSSHPIIKGFVTLDEPVVDTLQLKRIKVDMSYDSTYFTLESSVDEQHSRLVQAELELPYIFSFSDTIALPPDDTPLKALLSINRLDLARMAPFITLDEAHTQGFLDVAMTLDNTISDPIINGAISIDESRFSYPTMGMYYDDISLHSRIVDNDVVLDSLTLLTPKGKLQFKGFVEIDSLRQADIGKMHLNMSGSNFKILDSEMASALINANLDIAGTPEKPVFDGYLSVQKSAFNVDLLMKEFNRVYDNSNQPMLLAARAQNETFDSPDDVLKKEPKKSSPDLYKNLRGSFDIDFPRNTWIKGESMNFELLGKIKAIKEGERLSFFGTLNVNKGYYKLYGRRLDFENGELLFTGGSSLNPQLNFDLAYRFRDPESHLRKLNIRISDRLSAPKISFFVDDIAIEEKEAISYLLFNKSLNQLNTKESRSMTDTGFDLVLNQITGLVGEVLKSKLGLDVLEISGNEGWTQSTVSTGKYLTNNIYMNYEHTFAMDKKDKVIQPQKITLEYQIYRSMFIQATNQSSNSGFDFILKWSFK